jgi:crotonobetainyl-CoA:carnitine CoA-transferase CaiB-like acyl-CoA transferase
VEVFEGLRVVEFAEGMAGPLAGAIMADNGADIVKVEPPEGDWARNEPAFMMWNRGKKSAVLDLKDGEDRGTALRLASSADVILEAFRPGVAAALGIDYASVARDNPRAVYCSISGFNGVERLGRLHGYESLVAAKLGQCVGLDEVQGAAHGRRWDRPIYKAVPVDCYAASQLAVQGVATALLLREQTGKGQWVRTSLLQGAMTLMMRQNFAKGSFSKGRTQDPMYRGIRLTFMTAECADGKWIQMCARQDHLFRNWVEAVGLIELLGEPRYAGAPTRIKSLADIEELETRLRERMRTKTQAEWMRIFIDEYDVGADPFLTPAEFLEHPQMVENGRVVEVVDPTVGVTKQPGPLVIFSDTASVIGAPAPRLGEHTAETLAAVSKPAKPIKGAKVVGGRPEYPLAGITVLELAYYLAAPLGCTILAELGARVIKVETPDGDPWRRLGLEAVHLLHGKESVVLDLKSDEGREVLHKLIARSDVLVTSFRPGVPDRLGFGFAEASAINPELVYLYAASYGSKGPQSHRAAFHSTPNALGGGGILQAGEGNRPVDDGYPDPVSGLGVATAVTLGLLARQRTGKGQYMETMMLSSTAYALSRDLVIFDGAPERRLPDGEQRGESALCRIYDCESGWCTVCAYQDKEWRALADALGHPEWIDDVRFASYDKRLDHDDELIGLLEAVFAERTADEWERAVAGSDAPIVAVSPTSLGGSLAALDVLSPAHHAVLGDYWRMPAKIDFADYTSRVAPAPLIGENTRAILTELGYADGRIDEMVAESGVAMTDHDGRVVAG